MMERNIWTVNDLVSYIKHQLTSDAFLSNVTVCGEIGNFTNHFSGHWYFSIKDNNAFINCAMFRYANSKLNFIPEVSQQVIVKGSINVFEKSGQLQLIVTDMQPLGVGKFYLQFEQTKRKLAPLGYFSNEHKKRIPLYPLKIAVVTGANTAALQDIKITLAKRWPIAKLHEFNALVQGDSAAKDMIRALKQADNSLCDVIILARGGGSVDDLWCFNDEELAKTIYQVRTPIVTGIGHEIDTTIADLVSDERCATPTAAATRVSPLYTEVLVQLSNYQILYKKHLTNRLQMQQQTLDYYFNQLNNFKNKIDKLKIYLDNYQINLKYKLNNYLNEMILKYTKSKHQLNDNMSNIKQDINEYLKENQLLITNIYNRAKEILAEKNSKFQNTVILLENLNPLNILKRGFSLTYSDNKLLRSVTEISVGQDIDIRYYDGIIKTKVKERKEYE